MADIGNVEVTRPLDRVVHVSGSQPTALAL